MPLRVGLVWTAVACAAFGQITGPAAAMLAPRNLDFEEGTAEWFLAQDSRIDGYTVEDRKSGCHAGSGCAVISAGPNVKGGGVGTIVQNFDATPYRGKTMRLRAWVRLDGGRRADRIRLTFAVDREKKSAEYVQKKDVRSAEWTLAEVTGKVENDATDIHIAIAMWGQGKAWVDDVAFEVV